MNRVPTNIKELFAAYKKWVINNPKVVSEGETLTTWSLYLVAGKINKSPIVSELVYTLSKLLSLLNDNIIRKAYGYEHEYYSLKEQIKLCLTVIHYSEVFVELLMKNRWGNRGKWTATTLLQIFKCSSALILLLRYKELPVSHPPIASLQRRKFMDGREVDSNENAFFTLQRSGRIVRRVDGAPPVSFRDWEPPKLSQQQNRSIEISELYHAEMLHILKPLIHLVAMRAFGQKAWKQWLVALGLDLASLKIYNRHIKDLTHDQKLEISRRKLSLILYLLRSPVYNCFSRNLINNALSSFSHKIPILSFITNPIIQHLGYWQDIYFYMWSS